MLGGRDGNGAGGCGQSCVVLCCVRPSSSVVVRWFMTSMVFGGVGEGGVSREVEVRSQSGEGNRVFVFRSVGSEALWL